MKTFEEWWANQIVLAHDAADPMSSWDGDGLRRHMAGAYAAGASSQQAATEMWREKYQRQTAARDEEMQEIERLTRLVADLKKDLDDANGWTL